MAISLLRYSFPKMFAGDADRIRVAREPYLPTGIIPVFQSPVSSESCVLLRTGQRLHQQFMLVCVEKTRTNQKSHPLRRLARKTTSAPFYHIHSEMGMPPQVELRSAHIERATIHVAQVNVALPDAKLAARVTHRRGTVATPAGLMEQQVAVLIS